MHTPFKIRQAEARRAFDDASSAFELGRPEDLRAAVEGAGRALNLVGEDASDQAGVAKPLIRSVLDQTKTLLAALRLNPTRTDLRVALLCVALMLGVSGHPWARTQAGAEHCYSCGSHRLVRTGRETSCVDCGWHEKSSEEG